MTLEPIRPTIRRIREFSSLPENWNSYDAARLTPEAVATADHLLVESASLPIYHHGVMVDAVPSPDGGVLIEWAAPHERFQLWINSDGGYAGVREIIEDGIEVDWVDIALTSDDDVFEQLHRLVQEG